MRLDAQSEERPDLRMAVVGAAAWAGGLVALLTPALLPLALVVGLALVVVGRRRGRSAWLLLACLLAGSAVAGSALVRGEAHRLSAVADLAAEEAVVTLTGRLTSDPVLERGRYGPYVLTRLAVERVKGREIGRAHV